MCGHQIVLPFIEELGWLARLAVERFATRDGKLLVNELAPRPHNRGHHTIEACVTSQYEQHLRAILNLPLGRTRLRSAAVMVNLLGAPGYTGDARYTGFQALAAIEGIHVNLSTKKKTKPSRKMAPVTITAEYIQNDHEKTQIVKKKL